MNSTKVVWTGRIVSVLISIFFAFNVLVKLFPQTFYPQLVEQMMGIGLPESILVPIAILEAFCTVIYLIPVTSVLGAVLFTGYLGGAMLAHLRVGQNVLMHVVLGMIIWLGVYLREPRLREILPIRRKR